MGHNHHFVTKGLEGLIRVDKESVGKSSIELAIDTGSLRIADDQMSESDRSTVQKNMESGKVLDIRNFPRITFKSSSVKGQAASETTFDLVINGNLELHGVSRAIDLPVKAEFIASGLRTTGEVELNQTDFGISPFRAFMGTVGVADTVRIQFDVLATPLGGGIDRGEAPIRTGGGTGTGDATGGAGEDDSGGGLEAKDRIRQLLEQRRSRD